MVTLPLLVTVAAGMYAPGHLGELTRYLPFELVDDVLGITGAGQKRLRALPSRVGMYFVLVLALFPGIGYLRVWDKMTAALDGLGLARPSEKGLRDLRRRLGPAPVRLLFDTIAGPLAPPWVPGVSYRGLRTVAFDGLNSVKVPDSDRNRSWLGKTMTRLGLAGYPAMRIVALAETGTRGLPGAVIGGKGERAEVPLARKLVPLLREGMLLLADRAYDAADLLTEVAAAGAHILVRGSASRKPAVEQALPDGSYLSHLDGLAVRIIEADLDVHGADGTRIGDSYRLITTLTDWRRYPAGELIRLYHERWEIEVTYLALRHTLLGGYVLRSRDRAGAEQELWALLTVYQLIRMAMTAAAEAAGADPDRASFTVALESAREQVITARGIEDPGDPAGIGRIGRAVLAGLLPARRARYSARKVKCSTSRYHVRDQDRPELPTRVTRVQITIIAPPPDRPAARPRSRKDQPPGPRQPRPDTRRDQVTRIMASQPGRDWAGRDLAALLGIKPRNMLTQLAEWTRLGFLAKTGPGRYGLPGPPPASAAPAGGQQDPAPAGIIAAAAERGEAAATHAASLPPPASFPVPAGTPRHWRQAGPARRTDHGRGTGSGPAASRPPSAATATASTKLRTAKNRDCTPALKPRPHARTLSGLLPAP
jgi:Insertion element 4 transposase N-terminal/Transposase DDE domain